MYICQGLIVCTKRGSEKIDPERWPIEPSWPQMRDAFDGDSIDFGCSQSRNRCSNGWRGAKYEIGRSRYRPTDAPSLGQSLLNEWPSLIAREPDCAAGGSGRDRPADRLFPPLDPLEVQVQEQNWAGGRSLQCPRVGFGPSAPVQIRIGCGTSPARAARQQSHAALIQSSHGLHMSHAGPPPLRQSGRCPSSVVSHSPIPIHTKGSALSDAHNQIRVRVSLDLPRNVSLAFQFGFISHHYPEKLWRTSSRTTRSPANFDALN